MWALHQAHAAAQLAKSAQPPHPPKTRPTTSIPAKRPLVVAPVAQPSPAQRSVNAQWELFRNRVTQPPVTKPSMLPSVSTPRFVPAKVPSVSQPPAVSTPSRRELPPLTEAQRALISRPATETPLPGVSPLHGLASAAAPPVALSGAEFAAAIVDALSGHTELFRPSDSEDEGRRIADEITASWLGADEELWREMVQIIEDPAFLSSSSTKYADAPTTATLASEGSADIPTGAFSLAMDHARRLSFAFAKSLSRATRLSFLTPVPSASTASSSSHTFPSTVVLKHQQLLYRSIIKKGVEDHAGCVLRYLGFCEEHGVPPRDIFPAKPDNVFLFLSSLGGLMRTQSISAYANSIRFWHTIHGLDFVLNE
ncbi:hypothetical protein P7C70_g8919, partial [Phenoliferia sp. Uapishka_3]